MSSDIARSVIDALGKRVAKLERENAALALVVRKMLLHYPAALNGITTEEELRAAIAAARNSARAAPSSD